ncbi:MAG: hypothetical protein ACIAQU_13055, partial [Phycisphaerales bacterium JB064]
RDQGDANKAAKAIANAITQKLLSTANERGCDVGELGVSAGQLAEVVGMRLGGEISSNGMDELLQALADRESGDVRALAEAKGLLIVQDAGAIDAWCQAAIDAQPQAAEEVRGGKQQAIGRLIGHAMQAAGGAGDPKAIRQRLLEMLG